MRSCWEGCVARTLLAALPFKVEEAYFFEQICEMTFSRNMLALEEQIWMFGSDDICQDGQSMQTTLFGCISRQLAERTQVGYRKESSGLGGDPETGPKPKLGADLASKRSLKRCPPKSKPPPRGALLLGRSCRDILPAARC